MNDRSEQELEQQLSEAIAAIWERRRDQVMGRVGVLVRVAESLRESAASEMTPGVAPEMTIGVAPEMTSEAKDEAHRLAGSLGSFGFDEGSGIATEIEELLSQVIGGPEWIDRVETKVMALKAYMETR